MMLSMPFFDFDPWRAYCDDGVPPIVLKKKKCFCACTMPGQTLPCLSIDTTFPTCCKFAHSYLFIEI